MLYFFRLGDSPASEFYVQTFRNTLFHIHKWWLYTTYEYGADRIKLHKQLSPPRYRYSNSPNKVTNYKERRSQWPRDLIRGSAATHLLGLWIRIPPGAWMSVSCECYVLSSRCLCVGLITRPEESYRVWCVWVWSWSLDYEEALTHWALLRHGRKKLQRSSGAVSVLSQVILQKCLIWHPVLLAESPWSCAEWW
jgi:hypothetical protein